MKLEMYEKLLNDDQSYRIKADAEENTGIMLSTLWNQSGIAKVGSNTTVTYNEYCPYASGTTTHSLTGCTNTAAGQIIYYFIENFDLELQLTLTAEDAYVDDNKLSIKADGSTPGTVSFDVINEKLADYDLESADDAAALVYACGVVQEATYGGDATSTAWNPDLFYRSGFECVNQVYFYSSADSFWGEQGAISEGGFEVLIENLTAGRVVGTSYPGHALVIDGYDSATDKFHINFGWGNSDSTRWYSRDEINEQEYYHFVYDLMIDGEKDLYVTDSRVYGTGTAVRAFELAGGTKGANTITFDESLEGEILTISSSLYLREEITVNDFNMSLLALKESNAAYGFYAYSGAAGDFDDFTGNVIANGGNTNYAFQFYYATQLDLETDNAIIYAGKYLSGGDDEAGAEAVLSSLQNSQEKGNAVEEFVIDSSESSYSVYGSSHDDVIVFDNGTISVGRIILGNGDDSFSVLGGSRVYGDISCGDGGDVITIDSSSSVTGCLYGSASLKFLLENTPGDEAMFHITTNVYNINSNATVTVDLTDAQTGEYTLFTADSDASYISSLNTIEVNVSAGTSQSFTLSVNGESDCDYAELKREENSLVLYVKKDGPGDTEPPTVPGSLSAEVSDSSVTLDWADSTDNTKVTGYFFRYGTSQNLSGDGTFVAESEAALDELANGTYYYQVRAQDAAGNLSDWSEIESFTINYVNTRVTITSGGTLVSAGGLMTDKTVSGTEVVMNISSGGSAAATTVLGGGIQYVSSGGAASDTRVSSGGSVQILEGGNVDSLTVYEAGEAAVFLSGNLSNAAVSGGILNISSGGAVSGLQVTSGGELLFDGTGSASAVEISKGGIIGGFIFQDPVTSYSSVSLQNLHVKNVVVESTACVGSDNKAENVNILSGGILSVSSGGSASEVLITSGGTLYTLTGAVLSGRIDNGGLLSGGTGVNAAGAVINFALEERTSSDDYLVHEMDNFAEASYTITVAGNQARGTYKLAYNSANFTRTISISDGLNQFGDLSVNGEALVYGNYEYKLVTSGNYLNLTVTPTVIPAPQITADITGPTNSSVQLTALFDEQAVVKEFRVDGGEWQSYTSNVTVEENCLVEFRCRDSQGTYSLISSYRVANIDKTAPVITLIGDNQTPADSVTLSAAVDDGSVIMFSQDRVNWETYTAPLTVSENGTWYFKATDAAGNVAEQSITFSNIRGDTPEKLLVVANITDPTSKGVILTALSTAEAERVEFSTNGKSWHTYSNPILVNSNCTVYFREIDALGNGSEVVAYTIDNIDRAAPDVPKNFSIASSMVDWDDAEDNGSAGIKGYRFRYGTIGLLSGEGQWVDTSSIALSGFSSGTWYCQVKSVDAAGNSSDWSEVFSFTITEGITSLTGSAAGIQWTDDSGASAYVVEYSQDGFDHALAFEVSDCGADTYGLPGGTWQWRIDTSEGSGWVEGNEITAASSEEAQKYISDADSVTDLFFGNPQGVWQRGYAARHEVTGERVLLAGKNKLTDIFEGSADANVLVLTDDANGDALFVDDIYSAMGAQARMVQIDEIRTGAGDDIVDMTSRRYDYDGRVIRIHGGEGNDILWGGADSNILFGDAGDDRLAGGAGNDILAGGIGSDVMQGGGGDDIFTFCADWGKDTVEQLASGRVTLWFESGSESNWDAASQTYTDGTNSVTVSGCTDVTLRFGYDAALPEEAFAGESTRRVYEEKEEGLLA